jgi:hypothetical protein
MRRSILGGSVPTHDLEGTPRPQGSAIEPGAYEIGEIFADGFESGDTAAW